MARVKKYRGSLGLCALYEITETYTHALHFADGSVMRGDPENHFWGFFGKNGTKWSAWGQTPPQWDDAKAVVEPFTVGPYEVEWDVS